MANELQGRRIAFVIANEGAEQVELTEPWQAVQDAGGSPELLAPQPGQAQAFNHLDKADTFQVDRAVGDADPASYDALRSASSSSRNSSGSQAERARRAAWSPCGAAAPAPSGARASV